MSRAVLTMRTDADRAKACDWIKRAPHGARITFAGPQRSISQNDHLWACLTDVATQLPWHGVRMDNHAWKLVFLESLRASQGEDMRLVPNIAGDGFVQISGRSSSELSKAEMGDLLDLIYAFGNARGVHWQYPSERRAA